MNNRTNRTPVVDEIYFGFGIGFGIVAYDVYEPFLVICLS